MRKYALMLVCLLCTQMASLNAEAGVIRDVFVGMPDSLMPMLSQNARKDLIDFYESGMNAVLDNEWGSKSQIMEMRDDHMLLREDPEGSVTTSMTLLARGRDTLICMVRTIRMPRPDSELFVYDSDWKPVPSASAVRGFSDSERSAGIYDYTEMKILPQPDGHPLLVMTLDTSDGVAGKREDAPKAELRYKWNGSKFVKQKQ